MAPALTSVPRRRAAVPSTLAEFKDETERAIIAEALERNSYNRLRAAAELGISRMTLYKKLHKYGLMGTRKSLSVVRWCLGATPCR